MCSVNVLQAFVIVVALSNYGFCEDPIKTKLTTEEKYALEKVRQKK